MSGSVDTTIKIWNIQRQECLATLKGHSSTVRCLEYIPSKNLIISSSDNVVKLWNVETASLIQNLKLHTAEISAIQYDPHKDALITASDKTIKITDMKTFSTVQTLSGTCCFLFFWVNSRGFWRVTRQNPLEFTQKNKKQHAYLFRSQEQGLLLSSA